MKREEIIRRLELKFPGLKVIKPIGKVNLLVEDCYGIMKIRVSYINSGWKPSIQTAVDKTEYFKNRLKEIQPDLVVLSEYIGFPKKILVKTKYGVCKSTPSLLLTNAYPTIDIAINKTEYFINKAKELHGNLYDYSKVNYLNGKHKVSIICKKHGEFKQTPNGHLRGNKCSKCSNEFKGGSWYKNTENLTKASTMYILKFEKENETFFKFGITVNLINRIRTIQNATNNQYHIQIIKQVKSTVEYCYFLERRFKKMIKNQNRSYLPTVKFGGMYECFTN